jgi:hypothetical protein
MAWEWMVLIVATVLGPALFHAWTPTQVETTFANGLTYTARFSPLLRIVRTMLKMAFMWGVALGLAQLERRLWLQLWVIAPAALGLAVHFSFVKSRGVHWRTGASVH